jgi:hypothetical protein
LGTVDLFRDLRVDLLEGVLERSCNDIEVGEYGGEPGPQDAVVGAGEEQRGAQAALGDAITEAVGPGFDETMEAQAAQSIGDGALGELFWGAAGQGGKMAAQIVMVGDRALIDLPMGVKRVSIANRSTRSPARR